MEGSSKDPVIQPFDPPAQLSAAKERMSKEDVAKMVTEFDKKSEFFKDHPYEVSHYSQKMIKRHDKENYWTDQAEPMTPSFNDEDPNAGKHPMGFTVAQLGEEGMQRKRHHHHTHHQGLAQRHPQSHFH